MRSSPVDAVVTGISTLVERLLLLKTARDARETYREVLCRGATCRLSVADVHAAAQLSLFSEFALCTIDIAAVAWNLSQTCPHGEVSVCQLSALEPYALSMTPPDGAVPVIRVGGIGDDVAVGLKRMLTDHVGRIEKVGRRGWGFDARVDTWMEEAVARVVQWIVADTEPDDGLEQFLLSALEGEIERCHLIREAARARDEDWYGEIGAFISHGRRIANAAHLEAPPESMQTVRGVLRVLSRIHKSECGDHLREDELRRWRTNYGKSVLDAIASARAAGGAAVARPSVQGVATSLVRPCRRQASLNPHAWPGNRVFLTIGDAGLHLDSPGHRIGSVSTTLLVLMRKHVISRMMVPACLLASVAASTTVTAQLAVQLATSKLAQGQAGLALAATEHGIIQLSVTDDDAADSALMAVDSFSTHELLRCADDATHRTQICLQVRCPHAHAAIAVAMELVRRRRERLNVDVHLKDAALQLICTLSAIPNLSQWHPTQGTLRVKATSLRPQQRLRITELANERPELVTEKGGGRTKQPRVFVFDSLRLWQIIGANR